MSKNLFVKDGKHRGVSVFGWDQDNETAIVELLRNNVEWVAVTPFFYQRDQQTVEINVPEEIGKWSRRDSLFIRSIQQLHAKGIHVQLKPHLWMRGGWRSNIKLPSDDAWDKWFESYRKNMIHYAQMAEMTKVELLCIGTELKTSVKKQPKKWHSLVKEIKTIYSGKLTYAANWDGEFELIDFWHELDYIGIQAYFPLTKRKNPELDDIKRGWVRHIKKIEAFSKKHNTPILFTEVGYKSEAFATIKPWEWDSFYGILLNTKSNRTQQLAYEAMFELLWAKDWFAGVYIWQWDTRTPIENTHENLDFSPRYKPAENILAKWYGKPEN